MANKEEKGPDVPPDVAEILRLQKKWKPKKFRAKKPSAPCQELLKIFRGIPKNKHILLALELLDTLKITEKIAEEISHLDAPDPERGVKYRTLPRKYRG